jgi:DNA-binding MarR family transcriptional regulator
MLPAEIRALADFRFQIRTFLAFSEGKARAVGMEPQQHQLLLALKGLPRGLRPTIGTLAERLLLKHHSVVELSDRLVKKKLLEKRRSPDDGREILLHITVDGERLLRKLSRSHQVELQAAAPALIDALVVATADSRAARKVSR